MKSFSFVRDILVKLLLIVIFVFLLMFLFPMPNLTPFYSAIFNNNIQTMKDAAEDYYTTERMPKEVGKSDKMTLKQMVDEKLIIPFVDKDGNNCDSSKSYVKVTKLDNEYELKVSLTCGKESNYIIEKIGCYNFCPTGNCTIAEAKKAEEEALKNAEPLKANTSKDGIITVTVPTGYYVTEYEYVKKHNNEDWTLDSWRETKLTENADTKLVDTKTEYTGQKKVTSGTTLYEQISYGLKDNWVTDNTWTNEVKTGKDVKKVDERDTYTGQKKVETEIEKKEYVLYDYKDNWTCDNSWTDEVKTETATLKKCDERTVYTGQKKVDNKTTLYEHNKYVNVEKWTETGYSTTKKTETADTVLIGTRYTVTKKIPNQTTVCNNYVTDSNWYTSVPANTSSKVYSATPVNSKVEYDFSANKVKYDSFRTRYSMDKYVGNLRYDLIKVAEEICNEECHGVPSMRYYYYRVIEGTPVTYYQYKYCTPTTTTTYSDDTKVVTNLNTYINNGYTLVKTEYNYKIRSVEKKLEDTIWTTSKTSPSGYVYTNNSKTNTTTTYVDLGKYVASKAELGEYTYNIKTKKQYKYQTNNKTKYVKDTKWITKGQSIPSGYVATTKVDVTKTTTYEDLGKYVTSKSSLGEYTYNIKTKKQYKYAYNNPEKYVKDTIWTVDKVARNGYELTGKTKTTTKVTYVDLGKWVGSKAELGEYTENIITRTLYLYKHRKVTTSEERKWAKENPGDGFEPTGNSRKTYISTGTKTVPANRGQQ